jgi:hypothetical protein
MSLIVALGAIGVGYAMWSDEITIDGEVYTGSVGIDIIDTSNTIVWKDGSQPNEINVMHYWESEGQPQAPDPNYPSPIAWADADYSGGSAAYYPGAEGVPPGDDEIYLWYENLFPCINFEADFLLKYTGTIPGKIKVTELAIDNAMLDGYKCVTAYESNEFGERIGDALNLEGYQIHENEYVIVVISIHIPQTVEDPNLGAMDQFGVISGKLEVQQWNEYEAPQ